MLYTGKGDNGTTKLFGCDGRIGKDEPHIQALGNLDELNSWIGLCVSRLQVAYEAIRRHLQDVQEDLFVIQAMVAGASKALSSERLAAIESAIAEVEAELPPLKGFTIAGATEVSASLDVARTIARRAERSLVSLEDETLRTEIVPYLNRLSSLLFAFARLAAHRSGIKEHSPRY